MQQKKRPLVWIMLVTMVFSLFPQGLFGGSVASAANAQTTYFTPDNTLISNTSDLNLDDSTNTRFLSRSLAYQTTSGTITITGAYAFVSKDTMRVKVEQLNSVVEGNKTKWEPDATRSNTTAVTASTAGNNKFSANNLTLFPGFNRITFYGSQGSVERSDTFYVLYDQVPFIQDFKIFTDPSTGSNTSYGLNEGSQTVVNTQFVSVQGKVQNANKVTVSLNGEEELDSSLLQNGTFFTPQLKLKAGLNNLKFKIANGSDSVITERAVYYYDKDQPFSTLNVMLSTTDSKSVLDNIPTFSTTAAQAQLDVQMVLPYAASNSTFKDVGSFTVNGTTMTFSDPTEIIIPGPDGSTPEYRIVTFKTTNAYPLQTDGATPAVILKNQTVNAVVGFGNFSSGYQGKFIYAPGVKAITNMYYLPDYNGGAVTNKVALNNAQIDKESFYIMVESSQDIGAEVPIGEYLPTGATKLTIEAPAALTPAPSGLTTKQAVYLVKNLANGTQKIRFYYSTPDPSYDVTVSYSSKSYIYVANLYDGQTYTFNSKITQTLKVDGEFVGFSTLVSPQFVGQLLVNGVNTTVTGFPGTTDGKFSFALQIGGTNGNLVYGENTITITGTDKDGAGKTKVIEKKLRIYISDSNVSNIDKFMPVPVPTDTRQDFTKADVSLYTPEEMSNIFKVTTDFIIRDGKYVTSEERYDLVFKGGGAQIANLYSGSKLIYTYNPMPETDTADTNKQTLDSHISDFAGNQDEFMVRIRNYVFDTPGSHVYTLELINSTGARTTQRLEIVREPSSYRILSPVATVGEQIVVNKNYVNFDIEAEGATQVLIDKVPAIKRPDMNDRFVLNYVGLKQDKSNAIKIQIIRDGATINDTINVFYTGTVGTDAQYMTPKIANKYSVFNKKVELAFPKGTILQSASKSSSGVVKFYPDNKILFGIADPKDGVLERKNDYGFNIGQADPRSTGGLTPITVPTILTELFNSNLTTSNFVPISETYWINGGIGELGDKGSSGYKPGTDGVTPYSLEGSFTQYPTERVLVPSNRGTLTLAYDPTIVDEVGSTITVFRYTDKTNIGEWVPIGGVVDTKKHTITVSFDEFGYYKVMKQSKSYQDITNHPWARNLLNALYSKGIMNNLRFNAFGADDQTTRGEFATLLIKGLDIPLNYTNTQTFTDVSPTTKSDTWDYASIETAARAGIVTGLSDGYFGVEDSITREQAAVMIARAMSSKLAANDSKLSSALAKSFQDSTSIEYYARPSVQAITKAKIMEGSPVQVTGSTKTMYQFNPKGNLTRAEAAKIAVELLKKSTKLFPKTLS